VNNRPKKKKTKAILFQVYKSIHYRRSKKMTCIICIYMNNYRPSIVFLENTGARQ